MQPDHKILFAHAKMKNPECEIKKLFLDVGSHSGLIEFVEIFF